MEARSDRADLFSFAVARFFPAPALARYFDALVERLGVAHVRVLDMHRNHAADHDISTAVRTTATGGGGRRGGFLC